MKHTIFILGFSLLINGLALAQETATETSTSTSTSTDVPLTAKETRLKLLAEIAERKRVALIKKNNDKDELHRKAFINSPISYHLPAQLTLYRDEKFTELNPFEKSLPKVTNKYKHKVPPVVIQSGDVYDIAKQRNAAFERSKLSNGKPIHEALVLEIYGDTEGCSKSKYLMKSMMESEITRKLCDVNGFNNRENRVVCKERNPNTFVNNLKAGEIGVTQLPTVLIRRADGTVLTRVIVTEGQIKLLMEKEGRTDMSSGNAVRERMAQYISDLIDDAEKRGIDGSKESLKLVTNVDENGKPIPIDVNFGKNKSTDPSTCDQKIIVPEVNDIVNDMKEKIK